MRYVIPENEQSAMLAQINSNKGINLHEGFKVGDRVSYRGVDYTLVDSQFADEGVSTAVILSASWLLVRGIAWSDLRKR